MEPLQAERPPGCLIHLKHNFYSISRRHSLVPPVIFIIEGLQPPSLASFSPRGLIQKEERGPGLKLTSGPGGGLRRPSSEVERQNERRNAAPARVREEEVRRYAGDVFLKSLRGLKPSAGPSNPAESGVQEHGRGSRTSPSPELCCFPHYVTDRSMRRTWGTFYTAALIHTRFLQDPEWRRPRMFVSRW